MNDEVLVSIILPAYNCGNSIFESIDTILKQSYKNFELIIVYDESIDNTYELILKSANIDSRIKIIFGDNCGLSSALNLGLKNAKGIFLARMDGDDLSDLNRIEFQLDYLLKGNYDIVGCHWSISKNRTNDFTCCFSEEKSDLLLSLIGYTPFAHGSVLFRRSIFDDGAYRYRENTVGEDIILWRDLYMTNVKFGIVPINLYTYFQRNETLTSDLNVLNIVRNDAYLRIKSKKILIIDLLSIRLIDTCLVRCFAFSELFIILSRISYKYPLILLYKQIKYVGIQGILKIILSILKLVLKNSILNLKFQIRFLF